MKIRLLSDLHLEFNDFEAPEAAADVVVLAGDIDVRTRGVAWAAQQFPDTPVIYVAGNHEYYGGKLGYTLRKMKEAAAGTSVHVLDNDAVVIAGVRFLGGTLWTDYRLTGNQPLAQWDAQQRLSDFRRIRDDRYHKLSPARVLEEHHRTRQFFSEQLSQPFAGPTVVVSHHAPSELSLHPRFHEGRDHLNAAYASRLDALMGGPALWLHGHTHDSFDYVLHGTRVVCNPRGYSRPGVPDEFSPDVNCGFDPRLVLEV